MEARLSLDVEAPVGGWDSMLPTVSEDRLLLLESVHRTNNEVAAALAALGMIRPARGSRLRWRLLAAAIERLEGFAEVNRVLALPVGVPVALSVELERLCAGLGAARREVARSGISLDLGEIVVDGATARRVLLIAAELVHNAIRHALEGRKGSLSVVLRRDARDVMLGVVDDGPGMEGSSGTSGSGMGGPIVAELVRRADGVIECRSGPDGTRFHVALPCRSAAGVRNG